ncbi:PQQ-dependent sugar dehydrogenase [Rhodococcoides trifolii]|nr:PQQ-dependent sugar dehydrogenase [Rhodococcus trifolii]
MTMKGRSVRRTAAVVAVASVTMVGCARFDDSASSPFSPEPSADPAQIEPVEPNAPRSSTPPPSVPPGPCVDPDANVVATCLDPLSGLVVLPDGVSALVAERKTGRILQVASGASPVEVAKVTVDGSGDGGLLDVALSPTYAEDRLIYAYITTSSDNRVVRIAPGDVPKPVLTGIPRGGSSNAGAIDFIGSRLLVLTGDAGSPSAATNPASLAGKVLRVDDIGTDTGSKAPPQVLMSGIGRAGDICLDSNGSTYVTDATATEDRLQRITPEGTTVPSPVWTWPDRPGVAGCATGQGSVAVALTGQRAVAVLAVDPQTNVVTTAPSLVAQDQYGRLSGAAVGPDGLIWVSTVNKDGGTPTATDDRVVKIPLPAGGGSTV